MILDLIVKQCNPNCDCKKDNPDRKCKCQQQRMLEIPLSDLGHS